MSPNSNYSPLSHDRMGHKIISLTEDYDLETVFRNSLHEKSSSMYSFDTLLLDDGGEEDHMVVPMPLPIMSAMEIQFIKLRREHVKDFVQTY